VSGVGLFLKLCISSSWTLPISPQALPLILPLFGYGIPPLYLPNESTLNRLRSSASHSRLSFSA